MLKLYELMLNLKNREEGQSLTEYGLLLFLIAVVALGAITLLGEKVNDVFTTIKDALS
jgi:pilus assembly protein Flp/PilA